MRALLRMSEPKKAFVPSYQWGTASSEESVVRGWQEMVREYIRTQMDMEDARFLNAVNSYRASGVSL